MKLMIGTPRLGNPSWPFVTSLLGLRAPHGYTFVERGPAPVDIARNQIVAYFLQTDATHLLMIDSDAVLHPNTFLRLASWQKPIVAALAFMRKGPCLPTVFKGRRPDDPEFFQVRLQEVQEFLARHRMAVSHPMVVEPRPDDALFEVDRTGCHCVLIAREVFDALSPPWFVRDDGLNAREDFYFYERAQEAGFPIYVDLSCMTGHLYGDRVLAALDHLVWDASSVYGAPLPGTIQVHTKGE